MSADDEQGGGYGGSAQRPAPRGRSGPRDTAPPQGQVAGMQEPPPSRSMDRVRQLARALQENPIPTFTKKDLETRWGVSAKTVLSILREHNCNPGPVKGAEILFTDVLRCEGVADPESTWAFANSDDRTILLARLLTIEEQQTRDRRVTALHLGSYRRHAREGRLQSIRLAKFHRFRPDLAAARQWLAAAGGARK